MYKSLKWVLANKNFLKVLSVLGNKSCVVVFNQLEKS